MRYLASIILFVFFAEFSYGKSLNDSIPVVYFQLIDATNSRQIPLAHVINNNTRKGTIADMLGFFKIPIGVNDTLTITAVGYHPMRLPSWGQFSADSLYYPIRLTPRSYEIREVRITRFGSYQRFIREAATMDMPKSDYEKLQERLQNYITKQISFLDLRGGPPPGAGIVFGKDWFMLQRERIEEIMIEEQRWDVILRKFSAGIVIELTGLSTSEAIKFMEFCGFTEGYLLLTSDYEIRKRILDNFEEYKQTHLSQ